MKTRITSTLLVTVLASTLMLLNGGCSKKSVIPPDTTMDSGTDTGTTISYPPAENGGYSEQNIPLEGSLDDTGSMGSGTGTMGEPSDEYKRLHGRSSEGLNPVYFDFDQATIRPDMSDRMVMNSEYLKQVPGTSVVIEGNTDERGTNEYNLALAERRAQNTKRYLIGLGISSSRIRTVSFGEEKPLFLGKDEFSYSQNRRADFILE